ncbi:MAG TPA: helix-turn-helix transcriptional regulator [Actinoallomurus sp.]|nr:helix-turn-helix transcriptional regulator [Actinoallomurus sp.]
MDVELGEFLRACRSRLRPADVGLPPPTSRRRVTGLRREELAQLAGVSADYYTRLEQGRNRTASPAVLDALARALCLDDTGRAHLFDLAGSSLAQPRRGLPRAQQVRPTTVRLLEVLDGTFCPAFVLGRRTDILLTSRLAAALMVDFDALPVQERNYARFMFLDPYSRKLYPDWEEVAANIAAMLRLDAGRHPGDPWLDELVEDLSAASEPFRRCWAEHQVHEHTDGPKRYRHPVVGDLTVTYQALMVMAADDQEPVVYTTEPGSASERAIRLLADWETSAARGRGTRK